MAEHEHPAEIERAPVEAAAEVTRLLDAFALSPSSPLTPSAALALQRSAGNVATRRVLARNGVKTPARPELREPDPPDPGFMPRSGRIEDMLAQAEELCDAHGFKAITAVGAVGSWLHLRRRRGEKLGAWQLKGNWHPPPGIYMVTRTALRQILGPRREQLLRFDPKEEGPLKGRRSIGLPDWILIRDQDVGELFPPGGALLMVVGYSALASTPEDAKGDATAVTDPAKDAALDAPGYGSSVGDPDRPRSTKAAQLPALPSHIEGYERQPVGGTGTYQMELDWAAASTMQTAALTSMQAVAYRWEAWRIPPAAQDEWKDKAAQARRYAVVNSGLDKWDSYGHDASRRLDTLGEHADQYVTDAVASARDRRISDAVSNVLSMSLFVPEALVAAGATLLSGIATHVSDAKSIPVPWTQPGLYVIRCVAQPDPEAAARGDKHRASSVATKVVDVRAIADVADDALEDADKDLALLNLQIAQARAELGDAEETKSILELEADAVKRYRDAHDTPVAVLTARLQDLDAKVEDRKRTSTQVAVKLYDRELTELEDRRDDVRKQLDLAKARAVQQGGPDGRVFRLEAAYASRIDGQSYPLLLQVGQPSGSDEAGWTVRVADVTTKDAIMEEGRGATRDAAVQNAVRAVAGKADYDGMISVRLPYDIEPKDELRRFRVYARATNWNAAKKRLEELAIMLGLLALSGVGGAGLLAGVVGAAVAAARLYDRYRQGTLRADAAAVGDVVAIVTAFAGGLSQLGPLRLARFETKFVIYLARGAGEVGQAVGTFDKAVLSPASMIWGDLQLLDQMMEINEAERRGGSSVVATRERAKLLAGAINSHIGVLAHLKDVDAASKKVPARRGGAPDNPPPEPLEAPPPPVPAAPHAGDDRPPASTPRPSSPPAPASDDAPPVSGVRPRGSTDRGDAPPPSAPRPSTPPPSGADADAPPASGVRPRGGGGGDREPNQAPVPVEPPRLDATTGQPVPGPTGGGGGDRPRASAAGRAAVQGTYPPAPAPPPPGTRVGTAPPPNVTGQTVSNRTARRGGIFSIIERILPGARRSVEIVGRLLDSIPDRPRNAPNYNDESRWGILRTRYGLPTWEAAHLWGPGFGDEAAAGMFLASSEANQAFQNNGVEAFARSLHAAAKARGGEVRIHATAVGHGPQHAGGMALAEVHYEIYIKPSGGPPELMGTASFACDPPPGGKPHKPELSWVR